MSTKEKSKKTPKVVYIYFDSFEFKRDEAKEFFKNEPATGRVYRAIRFEYEGNNEYMYKVIVNPSDVNFRGIIIDELESDNHVYSYEAEVIDASKIGDIDLHPDDIDNIYYWEITNNEDILDLIEDTDDSDLDEDKADLLIEIDPSEEINDKKVKPVKNHDKKALRYNGGKPDYTLIDYASLEPLVRVLEFGANKYSRNNWRKGWDKENILASLQRHVGELIDAVNNGDKELDKETQLHQIGHILANAMFYSYHHIIKNKE